MMNTRLCSGSPTAFDSSRRTIVTRLLGVGALLIAGGGLAGCNPSKLPPLPEDPAEGSYVLGPGDEVRVITFDEPQLTGSFRVNDAGEFEFPLIGTIAATGLGTDGVAAAIRDRLKSKQLLRDPNVSIQIAAYRPVFVLGEVVKPGQYPFQPGMTVLTAVAIAGGFTYRAVEENAIVQRGIGGSPFEGIASRSRALRPGDIVTIRERVF